MHFETSLHTASFVNLNSFGSQFSNYSTSSACFENVITFGFAPQLVLTKFALTFEWLKE